MNISNVHSQLIFGTECKCKQFRMNKKWSIKNRSNDPHKHIRCQCGTRIVSIVQQHFSDDLSSIHRISWRHETFSDKLKAFRLLLPLPLLLLSVFASADNNMRSEGDKCFGYEIRKEEGMHRTKALRRSAIARKDGSTWTNTFSRSTTIVKNVQPTHRITYRTNIIHVFPLLLYVLVQHLTIINTSGRKHFSRKVRIEKDKRSTGGSAGPKARIRFGARTRQRN